MKRLQCLVASAIMVGLGHTAHATVRHVPSQYLTIQAAIDACIDGDTVVVANNTYSGLGNVNLDFKGLDIVVRSSGGAANCIIDCQNTANTRGFTFDSGEPSTAILAGFTIRNGNVTNPSGTGYGGGIFVNSGQPIIYQCIIEDCDANSGGGIAVHTGGGVMAHCIVRRNTATAIGTGPDVYGGGLEIRTPYKVMYSTVRDNIASVPVSGTNGAYGGGIAVGVSGIVTLRGTTIRDNQASGRSIITCYGGGMYVQQFASSSQTRIEDCLLIGNRASSPLGSPGGTGGALMARSDVSIVRSRFEGNAADYSGGAVYADIGWMNIDASIIRGNTAKWGGGIHTATFSTFSIANSLITDNIAQEGGGLALQDGELVSSCTITRNYASNGGGLHILGLNCRVENSIVWANVGSSGAQIEVQTSFPASVSVRYSAVGQASGDLAGSPTLLAGCVPTNPLFVSPLGFDGIAGTADDNFRVMAASPCIDSGSNALIAWPGLTDLARAGRRANDPAKPDTGVGPAPIVDMGAYERFGPFPWVRSARTATPAAN